MLLLTDMEPDDMVAIIMLLKEFPIISIYVNDHRRNQMELCNKLKDLLKILNKNEIKIISDEQLENEIIKHEIILCIKPPNELYEHKKLLQDKTIYYYGGYNFRVIGEKNVKELLSCSKKNVIFENKISYKNPPKEFTTKINFKDNNLNNFIKKEIASWKEYQLLNKNNTKITQNKLGYYNEDLLIADQALVIVLLLKIEPIFDKDNVYRYHDLDWNLIKKINDESFD